MPPSNAGDAGQLTASVARGKRLFTVTGCVACHHDPRRGPGARGGEPRTYPLSGLVSKTTAEKLAAYLARGEARPAYQRAFAAQLAVNTGGPPTG